MAAEVKRPFEIPESVFKDLGLEDVSWAEAATSDAVVDKILQRVGSAPVLPSDLNVLKEVGATFHHLPKHRILAAIAALKHPEDAKAWHELGLSCIVRSNWAAASYCYEAVFNLAPNLGCYPAWHAAVAALMSDNKSLLVSALTRFPLRSADTRFGILSQIASLILHDSRFLIESPNSIRSDFKKLAPWIREQLRTVLFHVADLTIGTQDRHTFLCLIELGSSFEIDAERLHQLLEEGIPSAAETLALPTELQSRNASPITEDVIANTREAAADSVKGIDRAPPRPSKVDFEEVEAQVAEAPEAADVSGAAQVAQGTRLAALQERIATLVAERDLLREQVRGQQGEVEQQYHELSAQLTSEAASDARQVELEANFRIAAGTLAKLRRDLDLTRLSEGYIPDLMEAREWFEEERDAVLERRDGLRSALQVLQANGPPRGPQGGLGRISKELDATRAERSAVQQRVSALEARLRQLESRQEAQEARHRHDERLLAVPRPMPQYPAVGKSGELDLAALEADATQDRGFYLHHERLGDLLSREGRIDDALKSYRRASDLKPSAGWISAKIRMLENGSAFLPEETSDTSATPLYLFVPFYTPKDPDRAAELLECLDRNLKLDAFAKVTLFVDDDTPVPRTNAFLDLIRLNHRPTYQDWVRESRRICPNRISVLANSDIYFDETVGRLRAIFEKDPQAFVALSRFDKAGDKQTPHPNPHWSQDTWAFRPTRTADDVLEAELPIPLGVPRCDNKVAYTFSIRGHRVYNPFHFVRSVHLHESNLRYYDKKGDRTVIGGMAFVHPSRALLEPATIDLEVWAATSAQYRSVKLNKSLEIWDRQQIKPSNRPHRRIIVHDADWQYPAITEKHAFEMLRRLLPEGTDDPDTVYLGFPFATLIDLMRVAGPRAPRTEGLREILDSLASEIKRYKRVVTVAQHIRAGEYQHIFSSAGVTDLFWSHCTKGEHALPAATGIRLHPFPLFPVQQLPRDAADAARQRKWLFSFVGARAEPFYLSNVRNLIVDILGHDTRGKVVCRDGWHYQGIVYDRQIRALPGAERATLIDHDGSMLFREIMDDSIFSLCPSGSGPNSIRLWEAALNGSIPVVLSDTWAPPGQHDLWEAATISCRETPEAVESLPTLLEGIASDPVRIRSMRSALDKLVSCYGPGQFVHDVLTVMNGKAPASEAKGVSRLHAAEPRHLEAPTARRKRSVDQLDLLPKESVA